MKVGMRSLLKNNTIGKTSLAYYQRYILSKSFVAKDKIVVPPLTQLGNTVKATIEEVPSDSTVYDSYALSQRDEWQIGK